ncbi:MAG: YqgE/AlgH family protein [Flavobacteriaceae bacterium]|nr:YqgE/AlgH family protein [Flavobacteriaceae bacterium]MCY4254146.1 YqgE/AlgH family protein [Flavobacteriaceae bacterium]
MSTPLVFGDASFCQSVVLLVEVSRSNLVGFVLNHKLNKTLDYFVEQCPVKQDLFRGGPVEMENLYYIHRLGSKIPNSIEIENGLFWSGDFKMAMALVKKEEIQSSDIRFFLGYAGWGYDQLMQEIKCQTWELVENGYGQKLLSVDPKILWKNEMSKLGGRYKIWSNAPPDPQLN